MPVAGQEFPSFYAIIINAPLVKTVPSRSSQPNTLFLLASPQTGGDPFIDV
jgi:hypothetical protein